MFKNVALVLLGTQIAPYVNPYIGRYVFDPLIHQLSRIEIRDVEHYANTRRRRR